MRLSAFWGLTAMVVSFCGVVQPKFEKPLLFVASPMIASTSVDASGAYAPAGVLNGVELFVVTLHRPRRVDRGIELPLMRGRRGGARSAGHHGHGDDGARCRKKHCETASHKSPPC